MKNLSLGIVGLPNVGKSTLFKVLTKQDITIANYPFATIDPNVGIVRGSGRTAGKTERAFKIKEKDPGGRGVLRYRGAREGRE